MRIFDLHADIGYDVMQKRKAGETDILNRFHLSKLQKGEIAYVCMASYFEGKQSWADMQAMILALKAEIQACEQVVETITKEDMRVEPEKLHAVLSVEGMCGIQSDVASSIDWLYEQGIRIASLVWNEENALATGAKGNPNRGLSDLGKEAIARMSELGMVIDVSHANEATFWDIMKEAKTAVIATHSNARALCDHPRNLDDDQLLAIAQQGGLIGVVSAPWFVSEQAHEQDCLHLSQHVRYLCQLVGIEHVACGFDFMDSFAGYEDEALLDMKHHGQAQVFIQCLREQGFSEAEIYKIAFKNAYDFLEKHLK